MRFLSFAALFSLIVLCAASLRAADIVWSGASSGNWTNTANWVGGAVPGASDVAVFDGTGATTTITNASGTIQGIRVTATTPVSVDLSLSGTLTLTAGTGIAIQLDGTNSLNINSTAVNRLVVGNIGSQGGDTVRVNDGSLTVDDVQFGGVGNNYTWVRVQQRSGSITLGAVTVVELVGGATGVRNEVEFYRLAGGGGVITIASLLIEGDTTDDVGATNEENAGEVHLTDVNLTVTGTITIEDGTGATGNAGNGGELRADSCTLSAASILVGNGASTVPESGATVDLTDGTLLTVGAGGAVTIAANASGFFQDATITSNGAYSITSAASAGDVILLNSTVTASTPGNLSMSFGSASSGFGLALINCDFSNYDANGLDIKANAQLIALNECNFTSGQSGGSHIRVSGLATPTNPFPADLNQFDLSTGTGTTAWVNVLSATSLAFRVGAGQDFGIGAATVNAATAESYDNDGMTVGSDIVWADTFNLMTAANGSTQPTGMRADTTADQPLFFFSLTANTGNSRVTSVQIELETENHNGSNFDLADIATVTLFNDANSNQTLDGGETLNTVASPSSNTITFTFNRTINQGVTENWGIAITFAASVVGEPGRLNMFILPTVGIIADNGTLPNTTIVGGLPVLMGDSIPVSGAPASLMLWDQPGDASANVAFLLQPRAVVVDADGQRVGYQNSGTVTPTIQNDPVGGSSLIGSDVAGVSVVAGYAQFTNLGIDQAGVGFVLRFTATGITFSGSGIVDSSSFNVGQQPPEIDVQRSSTSIPDGGADAIGNRSTLSAFTLTYVILNTGNGDLTLGTVTFPTSSNCTPSVQTAPNSPVGPVTGTTQLVVSVTLAGTGAFSFELSIPNDDPNEAPYNFTVSGTGIEPDISVERNTTPIADGGSDTLSNLLIGTATPFTYDIRNVGTETLTLTGGTPVTIANQFGCAVTVTAQPAGTVNPAAATTFTISVNPSAASFSFEIDIASNDPDEGNYDISVSGSAAATAPEIDIQRPAGTSIADSGTDAVGSRTPATAFVLTYTVENTGNALLTLGASAVAVSGSTNCTAAVTLQPATTVATAGTTTFEVTVTPSAGAFSFDLTINNDDANENPYNILVSGTGASPGGGGGGGDDEGGCSPGGTGNWLMLALLGALLSAVALRRRRA